MKKFFIFLVFMLLGIFLFALEMEVKSFKYLPTDMSGQAGKIIYDEDGNPCSVLKVETDLKSDLVLSKPTVHKKIDRGGGVYYFFIRFRERYITFGAKGYSPYTWKTPRMLTAGKTYLIKLNAKDEVLGNIPVVIQSEPKDAEKFINEKSYGTGETFKFGKGKYTLALKKKGYRTYEKIINVSENNFLFKDLIMEKFNLIDVHLSSFPNGAKIFINNQYRGETPGTFRFYPDDYNINLRLEKSGYLPTTKIIPLEENKNLNLNYPLKENIAYLNLEISPKDAQVYIDNMNMKQQRNFKLSPGTHKIRVERESYHSNEETISIKLDERINKEINLKSKRGNLIFNITPSKANVVLYKDNEEIKNWQGSNKVKDLLEGEYKIVAKLKKYKDYSKYFSIRENQNTIESCELEEIKKGVLEFSVTPTNAKIILSKKNKIIEKWKGSKNISNLDEGMYKIEIEADKYIPQTMDIEIRGDENTKIKSALNGRNGSLDFHINTNSANVKLLKNGKRIDSWYGSNKINDLFVGKYLLYADNSDYISYKKKIKIKENKVTKINFSLKKEEDFFYLGISSFLEGIDMIWDFDGKSFNPPPIYGIGVSFTKNFKIRKGEFLGVGLDYYCGSSKYDDISNAENEILFEDIKYAVDINKISLSFAACLPISRTWAFSGKFKLFTTFISNKFKYNEEKIVCNSSLLGAGIEWLAVLNKKFISPYFGLGLHHQENFYSKEISGFDGRLHDIKAAKKGNVGVTLILGMYLGNPFSINK